jgi:hypothetical protein
MEASTGYQVMMQLQKQIKHVYTLHLLLSPVDVVRFDCCCNA